MSSCASRDFAKVGFFHFFTDFFSVRKFAELKAMGVYQTRQEQGQERTWLHLENYETFDIRNKDEKDEIFIGHLPVSSGLLRGLSK